MHVLVTGGAGFIGSHLVDALIDRGDAVTVLDNFDPTYDPAIKRSRVERWGKAVRFLEGDIRSDADLDRALAGVDAVVHMAARAGVRPSIRDPRPYVSINVQGTQSLLTAMRRAGVERLVYASSSSVYGARTEGPFRESDPVNRPASPYAATKMAGELLCHAASAAHGLQVTCLRLFTVYGPRQRPEMAIHLFARRALAGLPVQRFGDGRSMRDYTYVSDTVRGILAAVDRPRPWAVYNLGCGRPVTLAHLLELVGKVFDARVDVVQVPEQPGDVPMTWADISLARKDLGYEPEVSLEEGLERFRAWLVDAARKKEAR